MVGVEGLQELVEDIVLSLLAGNDIWVLLGVVAMFDVIDVNLARAVLVENLESLHANVLSELVHLATNTPQELVVVNVAITIAVEGLEQANALLVGEAHSQVVHGLGALLVVKLMVTIVVEDFESSTETNDGSSTTGLELVSHDLEELLSRALVLAWGASSRSTGGIRVGAGWTLHLLTTLAVGRLWTGTLTTLTATAVGRLWTTEGLLLATHGRLRSLTHGSVSLLSRLAEGLLAANLAAPSLAVGLVVQVPGVGHHQGEVVIIVDGGRDVVVVFFEFLLGDDVVGRIVVTHVVSGLESLQELQENLLFGLLARDDIWVSLGTVDTSDIVDVNVAIAVAVELGEGLSNPDLAVGVHRSTNDTEELVVLDEA